LYKYYLAFVIGVVCTSIAQIFLKIGANKNKDKGLIKLYFNLWTITGYILFFSVVFFNTYALTKLPLITGIMFNPFIFILVGVLSATILKEKITKKQILGSMVIILGIVIFSLGNLRI